MGESGASHLRMLAKQGGDMIAGSGGPTGGGLGDCRQEVGKRLLWLAPQVERSIGSSLFQIAEPEIGKCEVIDGPVDAVGTESQRCLQACYGSLEVADIDLCHAKRGRAVGI